MEKNVRKPTTLQSLLLTCMALLLLMYTIVVLHGDAHIPLIISTALISLFAICVLHLDWDMLMEAIAHGIREIAPTILIFGIIGMMIAIWTMGGIVPTLIYYGLKVINPKFFLLIALLISSLISLSTGSSWTTVGTIGVVFLGVGAGFGVPMPMTAGAVISGAYFGDKISPLSDTTNLAPAVSGATLFEHVRHMLVSSGISLGISAVIFTVLGMKYGRTGTADLSLISQIEEIISSGFTISPVLLLVPVSVIVMGVLKKPAVPSLFLGVVLGAVCCALFQHNSLADIVTALNYGFTFESENELMSTLLSGGGIQNMMWSMSLTLCAICFGSVLDATQILHVLAQRVLRIARGTRGLIICTVFTCLGVNLITGDQYLGIILPGKMYRKSYEERGLAPQNLSRALEDSATVTSPLVPWSSCAAVMVAALGIPTLTYLPYCFFSMLSPLVSIFLAVTGISITMRKDADTAEIADRSGGK